MVGLQQASVSDGGANAASWKRPLSGLTEEVPPTGPAGLHFYGNAVLLPSSETLVAHSPNAAYLFSAE